MRNFLTVISVLVLCSTAFGASVWKLGIEDQAAKQANWGVEFTSADFATLTTTNTAFAFTNTFKVAANTAVECKAMVLDSACSSTTGTAAQAATGSCLLKVGDEADDDLYLTSTELNKAGTEVYVKVPPLNTGTIAMTMQTTLIYPTGTTNAGPPVVTNCTAAFTAAALGSKTYTTATNLIFTFTPNAETSLSGMSNLNVKLYFNLTPGK